LIWGFFCFVRAVSENIAIIFGWKGLVAKRGFC
jgi:hypothetical protein